MLPAAARLRAADDFAAAVRRGRRGASPTLVVHLLTRDRDGGPRAGFVVSGKVGNSVVRHRVTRRLRPLLRARLPELPAGSDVVVRALPAAATADSATLAAHLDGAVRSAVRRAGYPVGAGRSAARGGSDPASCITAAGSGCQGGSAPASPATAVSSAARDAS
jgi:ribonuclease P protein component